MTSNGPSWIGRKLGGRYEIEEILGHGGMSTVFRATDPNLKRKVAVKLIHPHLTDNPEFINRFEQEAAAIAQLRHNNIVQVHDFNVETGIYYMVMEYIAGETLGEKLQKLTDAHMHLPINEIITILAKVCDAVNYAHERRMIHRDLKPSNVMINLLGEPILMDFGIAKIIGGRSHTATGAAMGTASYMSPEQVRGDKSDHRTDIYSLGIMLYEMLSGELPFQGDSTFQVMLKHVNEPLPDIRQFDMNTPLSLITILERALAKEPRERYQSAKEMGTVLNTAGLQLHGTVSDTLAGRYLDRLAILWQQANDLFSSGKYDACIDKLEEMKQVDPDFQRIRVDELKLNAVDHLFARAAHLCQDGKYLESQTILAQLKLRSADDHDLEQLERKIQLGLSNQSVLAKLESLYEEANTLIESGAFEQALTKWHAIQHQRGTTEFPDLLEVEKRANEGICTSRYQQAFRAISDEKPKKALRLWEEITAVSPNYNDSQHIVATAKSMLAEGQQSRQTKQIFIVGGAVALLIIVFFIARSLVVGASEPTTPLQANADVVVTEAADVSVAVPIATETAVPVTATHTAEPATATSSPAPTATASPPPTLAPSPTAESASIVVTAVAQQNSSIFSAPDASSEEIAFISFDEIVMVLGRSANGSWLYIQTEDGEEGFVAASRFEMSDAERSELIIITPSANVPLSPTAVSGNFAPLSMVKYPLEGTGSCDDNNNWTVQIFVEGVDGNGVYTYFWNDVIQVKNQSSGSAFRVSGMDNNTIGMVRVDSGDGQSISEELFIPKPSCNN